VTKKIKITSDDCRSCGACCLGGFDDGYGWADCTEEDVVRMSPSVRRRLVAIRYGMHYTPAVMSTPTRMDPTYGKTCAFLRGTPGSRCSCSIYATRPSICSDFRPGGEPCREARRQLELRA
jgi:Fe-S-cluster containining protein